MMIVSLTALTRLGLFNGIMTFNCKPLYWVAGGLGAEVAEETTQVIQP